MSWRRSRPGDSLRIVAKQYVPTNNETFFSGLRQKDIYAEWEHSGATFGEGPAGLAKGNRLPFEPVTQKPGVKSFKLKGG